MGPWKKVQQRGKKVQKVGAALCNHCHSSTSQTQSGCSMKRAAEHLAQRTILLSNILLAKLECLYFRLYIRGKRILLL